MKISKSENLAHDFKTHLTVIKGYTSMLKDGVYGELSESALEVVAKISTSADELAGMIDERIK